MICAEDEIGVGNSHDGIIVLDSKVKVGTKVSAIYENYSDKVFKYWFNSKQIRCYEPSWRS